MKRKDWKKPKPAMPPYRITDSRFKYIPAVKTDVQQTWARFGWTPPSQKGAAHEHT